MQATEPDPILVLLTDIAESLHGLLSAMTERLELEKAAHARDNLWMLPAAPKAGERQ